MRTRSSRVRVDVKVTKCDGLIRRCMKKGICAEGQTQVNSTFNVRRMEAHRNEEAEAKWPKYHSGPLRGPCVREKEWI